MSQLLQHTPPAALTAEQQAQLSRCCELISQLQAAWHEAPSLKMQLVAAMLKQQAASNIGSLIAWVQQQPEQQLLGLDMGAAAAGRQLRSAPVPCAAGGLIASMWAAGVHMLKHFATADADLQRTGESAGAFSLAASLTQQLDQSGESCSRSCKCVDSR
jgi:hypothetical protein